MFKFLYTINLQIIIFCSAANIAVCAEPKKTPVQGHITDLTKQEEKLVADEEKLVADFEKVAKQLKWTLRRKKYLGCTVQ